ncbi:hypothetical protein PHET_11380, partial [Paragonimus heterotremus]
IPILEERAHYLVPTLTNNSVPFSCCRWKHTSSALAPVPCDHMLVQDPNTLFDRGCVEPLSRFIQQHWMGLHLVPLLVVILTMIPQMFLLLTTIQPKQLRIQSIEACIDFGNHMENRMKQFQMVGRGMFSMLSKSSTQFSNFFGPSGCYGISRTCGLGNKIQNPHQRAYLMGTPPNRVRRANRHNITETTVRLADCV